MNPTMSECRRRSERGGVGPRGAAALARGRAQGAAPLRQGDRGRRRLRRRCGRPGGAAHRARPAPPGRRRARAGRPAGRGPRAARQRGAGAACVAQAADSHPGRDRRHRAGVVRAARLSRPDAGAASRCRRCRCSRNTARCRRRPRPSRVHPADLWSVDWRWRDLPADPDAPPRAARRGDPRRAREPAAGADARAPTRRLRRVASATSAPVSAPARTDARGRDACGSSPRRCSRPRPKACCRSDVFTKRVASRLLAQLPHPRARRVRCLGAARPRPAVLLRAERAAGTERGAAPGRRAPGLRPARRRAGRLRASACSAASTPR